MPKFLVDDDGTLGARNAVECVSIEHKMGINASPTCVMAYDGAVGYLIGEPNQGMRYMFTMMNNARLSVGVEGLSIAERAYQQAVAYAHERRQGRAPGAGGESAIVEHADVRRMLLTMKAHIEAIRGIAYLNAEAIDLARATPTTRCGRRPTSWPTSSRRSPRGGAPTSASRSRRSPCRSTAAWATSRRPASPSTTATSASRRSTRAPTGSRRWTSSGASSAFAAARRSPSSSTASPRTADQASAAGGELAAVGTGLADGVAVLRDATAWLHANTPADANNAFAGATPYLRLTGIVTGAWVLTRAAIAAAELRAGDRDGFSVEFLDQKLVTAHFFVTQVLPQVARPAASRHRRPSRPLRRASLLDDQASEHRARR